MTKPAYLDEGRKASRVLGRAVVLVSVVGLGCGTTPKTPPVSENDAERLLGEWSGAIDIAGQHLEITTRFARAGDGLSGEIDIPAQGAKGLALDNVSVSAEDVHFELPTPMSRARFDGTLRGDVLQGTFQQGGAQGTFSLARGAPAQAPALAADTRLFSVPVGGHEIKGQLELPAGDGPFPVAVLITGSGPQTRDEDVFGFKVFRELSSRLLDQGVGVARFDDRGIGESTGDMSSATTIDFVDDARAVHAWARTQAKVDKARTGYLGHSEGSTVGLLAAEGRDDVAFVVMLSGPLRSGEEVLVWQGQQLVELAGGDDAALERQLSVQRQVFGAVRGEGSFDDVHARLVELKREELLALPEEQRPEADAIDKGARAFADGQVAWARSPWFKTFLDLRPVDHVAGVKAPLLAVYGGKDAQVDAVANSALWGEVKAQRDDVTVVTLPDANHLFQPAKTGAVAEYATLDKRFVDGLIPTLVAFWRSAGVLESSAPTPAPAN
jgi:alpha/beta superfamily hydrolase